uniref:Uncharacterized protein n=1 Tax=Accipiter nisus TaxID=211598 RepID=A0A8B9MBH4_9AVES
MNQAGKEKEALQLLAEADKKVRGSQSFFAGLFGECLLPGGTAPPAAAEQARRSHQLCGCRQCLQESRPAR